jgi:hypothetical protein
MADAPKPGIFECVRRYADARISSMLHSLIGLPSILPQPNWMEDDQTRSSGPATSSAGSGAARAEGSDVRASKDEYRQPEPSVMVMFPFGPWDAMMRDEWMGNMFLHDPEELFGAVWKHMMGAMREPLLAEAVFWGREYPRRIAWRRDGDGERPNADTTADNVEEEDEHEETELDAYTHLLPLTTTTTTSGSSGANTSTNSNSFAGIMNTSVNVSTVGKSRIISTMASTQSYTGPDGITRTKYVLHKRFADGTEEKVEEERTTYPRPSNDS